MVSHTCCPETQQGFIPLPEGTINPARIRVTGTRVQNIREPFWHWSTVALSSMFDDFTPPAFEVNSCSIAGNQLIIDLATDEEVVKVEVAVRSHLLNQVAIGRFDSIVMDLDTILPGGDSDILICAYDRFLNCSYRLANNVEITGTGLQTKDIHYRLEQNYPNPFSGITTIPFHLSVAGDVSLRIFDMNGNEILILLDQYLPEGDHTLAWNAAYIPAGTYIYCLEMDGKRLSRRMVVL